MADPVIKIKRSAVAGKIPTSDQLPLGEVALNTYDGKFYASKDVGIGTTVFAVNPWSAGVGTNTYNAYFTEGNVGIATTNPTSTLHVVGNARVTGVSTFGTTNTVVVGGATTALIVNDAALITTTLTAARTIVTANNAAQTPSLSLTGTVYSNPNKNGLFSIGQLGFNDTDLVANFDHSVNSYAQIVFQNKNAGTQASTDFVVANDTAGPSSYYGDFGINASGFVGSSVWDDPNGTYLYASAGSLSLGTDDAKDVRIATGSASNSPVTRITVRGTTGNVGIGSTLPTSTLDVIGNVKISNDLTVNGSTLYVNATNNRVGIATTNPTSTLHVVGNALITGIATINNNLVVNGGTLTVDSTNNRVGIATTNPTSTLHVVGNARVTGVSTFGTTNTVVVGGATTALIVNDAALITTTLTAARTIVTANNAAQTPSLSLTGTVYSNPNKNGLFSIGQLGFNDTDLVANFDHSVNSYAQIVFQNKNAGTQASTDFVVANDTAGPSSYYGDFGINASGFVGSSVWDDPNGTYLYASAGSLSLGTDDAKDVRIATGSASNSPVTRITVRGTTGNVGIGSTLPTSTLDVIGNVKISNDLTVNGSTLYVNATNNRVGIATTNPTSTLHVVGNARVTGVVTATSFVGDGSGLTGITASGPSIDDVTALSIALG